MNGIALDDRPRPAQPCVRRYLTGLGCGLGPVGVFLLATGLSAASPALDQTLGPPLFVLSIFAWLVALLASPICLFIRRSRLLGLGLGTGAWLSLGALLVWIALPYWLDARAMSALIARDLPPGASMSRVSAFLHGRDLLRFADAHQLLETSDDQGPPQRVARYDPDIVGWQDFPGGAALYVTMSSEPYGTLMTIAFTFDARGRLTTYHVDEGWAGI